MFPPDGLDVLKGAVEDVDVAGVVEAHEGGFSALPQYFVVGCNGGFSGIDKAAAADCVLFFLMSFFSP